MIDKEKIKLLQEFRDNLKNPDALKQVSNKAIELAAVNGDKELVALSLSAYALYKLSSKHHFVSTKEWPRFLQNISADLDECIKENKRIPEVLEKDIIKAIERVADRYSYFVNDVIHKARVKQASRAYAMGLSMATAADLTGAKLVEVANYAGGTTMYDAFESKKGLIERFKDLKRVLE